MSDPLNLNSLEEKGNRVKEAIRSGNKIEAIKLYREYTGLGLKDSKDAVERLEAEMKANRDPVVFAGGTVPLQNAAPVQAQGCFSVLFFVAMMVGFCAIYWTRIL